MASRVKWHPFPRLDFGNTDAVPSSDKLNGMRMHLSIQIWLKHTHIGFQGISTQKHKLHHAFNVFVRLFPPPLQTQSQHGQAMLKNENICPAGHSTRNLAGGV